MRPLRAHSQLHLAHSLDNLFTAFLQPFSVHRRRGARSTIPAQTECQHEIMNHPSAPLLSLNYNLDGLYTLVTFRGNVKRTVAWHTGHSNEFSPRYALNFTSHIPQPPLAAMVLAHAACSLSTSQPSFSIYAVWGACSLTDHNIIATP